jgi:hypothetical protein
VSPANATNKGVTFSSGDETKAAVDDKGLVTAKAAGTAVITVTTADGGFTDAVSVTVVAAAIPLTGITFDDGSALTLAGPEPKVLGLTLTPSDATGDIVWSSSDASIVAVDSGGIISAKKPGTATITVAKKEDNGTASTTVKADIDITVAEPQKGVKITGLSEMDDQEFEVGIFTSNTITRDSVPVASASGTVSDGVIEAAELKKADGTVWEGSENESYYVAFIVGDYLDIAYVPDPDYPGDPWMLAYKSKGAVSFSFDSHRPELSLDNVTAMGIRGVGPTYTIGGSPPAVGHITGTITLNGIPADVESISIQARQSSWSSFFGSVTITGGAVTNQAFDIPLVTSGEFGEQGTFTPGSPVTLRIRTYYSEPSWTHWDDVLDNGGEGWSIDGHDAETDIGAITGTITPTKLIEGTAIIGIPGKTVDTAQISIPGVSEAVEVEGTRWKLGWTLRIPAAVNSGAFTVSATATDGTSYQKTSAGTYSGTSPVHLGVITLTE